MRETNAHEESIAIESFADDEELDEICNSMNLVSLESYKTQTMRDEIIDRNKDDDDDYDDDDNKLTDRLTD